MTDENGRQFSMRMVDNSRTMTDENGRQFSIQTEDHQDHEEVSLIWVCIIIL